MSGCILPKLFEIVLIALCRQAVLLIATRRFPSPAVDTHKHASSRMTSLLTSSRPCIFVGTGRWPKSPNRIRCYLSAENKLNSHRFQSHGTLVHGCLTICVLALKTHHRSYLQRMTRLFARLHPILRRVLSMGINTNTIAR